MKYYLLLGFWLRISSGDGLHLWLLGALVYLNLFGIDPFKKIWGVNWIPRDFTRNIKSFGSSSICVVCDIDETQRIQHYIMTPVVRGHFRDRNKSVTIAQDNSTQWIIYWVSRIVDGICQIKIKSGCKSRISSKNSSRNKYMWSTHSQSDSLYTETEWIICSKSYSILPGKGGWRFSLSFSWFGWVFNRGWY